MHLFPFALELAACGLTLFVGLFVPSCRSTRPHELILSEALADLKDGKQPKRTRTQDEEQPHEDAPVQEADMAVDEEDKVRDVATIGRGKTKPLDCPRSQQKTTHLCASLGAEMTQVDHCDCWACGVSGGRVFVIACVPGGHGG